MEKFNRALLVVVSILILLYVLAPIFVLVISSFNESRFFEFPPTGFTLEWYQWFARSEEYQKAIMVSTRVAISAAALALLVGLPAAFALDRYKFRGNAFLQSIFLSPLMLPQIIWAIGLIQFYSMIQIGGRNVLGTFASLVLAHTVIIIPYVIRMGPFQLALCRSRPGKRRHESWRQTLAHLFRNYSSDHHARYFSERGLRVHGLLYRCRRLILCCRHALHHLPGPHVQRNSHRGIGSFSRHR